MAQAGSPFLPVLVVVRSFLLPGVEPAVLLFFPCHHSSVIFWVSLLPAAPQAFASHALPMGFSLRLFL